jgi:hypothetical protein
MPSLEAIDRQYVQKYKGRWVIGLDVILDGGICASGHPISNKGKDIIAMAPPIGATPVYMPLKTAVKLLGKLRTEIQTGGLEKLAEPMLYDAGKNESLVVVYLKKEFKDKDEGVNIKQDINDIARLYDAQIISFELSRNGKFYSIDFRDGLKLKNHKK